MGLNLFKKSEQKKGQDEAQVNEQVNAQAQNAEEDDDQDATQQAPQQTPQQSAQAAAINKALVSQQPGARLSTVFDRMYNFVASADLDTNSCFVESANCKIGDTEIPRRGYYDAFAQVLMSYVADEDKVRFAELFDRMRLADILTEGHSYASEVVTVCDQAYEIRAERIMENDPESTRVRCCIYMRPVVSLEDDGRVNTADKILNAESDKVLSTFFISSYEINVEKDMLIGYDIKDNVFVKGETRYPLQEAIETWIQNGTIHKDYAKIVQNFYRKGFLKKKTLNGKYTLELLLRDPGGEDYRWYEDTIFPFGTNFRAYRRDIDDYKKLQEQHIREEEQEKMYGYNQSMLCTLASVVEFRNEGNKTHISHVSDITRILLEDVAERSPQYKLDKAKIRLYAMASTIHDIGKVTIPDVILNKPGRLTDEEREVMKKHTINGARVIDSMRVPDQEELYDCCTDIALHHHERYDGKGYPEGLVGEKISIGAQAVAVADAYDALVSVRCYKEAFAFDDAFDMIINGECGSFNPRILESLKAVLEKIRKIYDDERKRYEEDKNEGKLEAMTEEEKAAENEIKEDMSADHSFRQVQTEEEEVAAGPEMHHDNE